MSINTLRQNLEKGAASLAGRRSLKVLSELAAARQVQAYLVGGTVREVALGREAVDLDLAISAQAVEVARDLARVLKGTFVLLDESEGTARVVAGAEILDLAEFRAPGLEGDLKGRDFTINALALDLDQVLAGKPLQLHDPLGGLADLDRGQIRMVAAENLAQDPLRLLRAYRFAATHGFALTPETTRAIRRHAGKFARVAGERVHQEVFLLLAAAGGAKRLKELDEVRLLEQIFPELSDLKGVPQDGFHHLDVFEHSLATAASLEEVLARPGDFFGEGGPAAEIARAAELPARRVVLKLAALFHDAGKPKVQARRTDPERYTFYHHERLGVAIFEAAARRLRMSQAESRSVIHLIRWHMRPFLLLPAFRRGELTVRALGRMVRAALPDLAGAFAVAMADSLAAQGPQRPRDAEAVLASLAAEACQFYQERLEPLSRQPRLITGHELIRELGLAPGPKFKRLLTAVEEAQWEGTVTTREEALALVRGLL